RTELGLFAGVRPVKAYPNTPQRLADARSQEIDFVVLRESTEGLFAEREKGVILEDREARDTMVITRQTCENLFDFAFNLSQSRKQKGGKGRVTCVDKSNVLRSMVFFRKIFDERALLFPDIQSDHNYVDAQALDLIRRPWEFDVLVMENMFADILSDLGGGLVGGMGMAPCAEIGLKHGLFQPAHGSAPDIMGKDLANPTAMFLSAAMMLEWLGQKYQYESLLNAAGLLESKIEEGFRLKRTQPKEFGGPHGCSEHTRNLLEIIENL
ncbi:MAG: isocitrate/isopropylmalate family dehydrogenase, partial [SAR324 cluster bacterium]|nr:isocitrate/isopropylmalate family dehydrogenase [SAR324 cluster bacterium]